MQVENRFEAGEVSSRLLKRLDLRPFFSQGGSCVKVLTQP